MKAPKPAPKMSPKYAGRLGGLIGGKARAEKLTAEERKEIAKKAAEARWSKASKAATLPLSED
jgi:hypothetical protein